jgi:hypothetical protein
MGKVRMDLVPPEITLMIGRVLTHGAEKYGENNWQHVQKERYIAAAYRHLLSYQTGEYLDDDSGLPHLAHAITSLAFVLWQEMRSDERIEESPESKTASAESLKFAGSLGRGFQDKTAPQLASFWGPLLGSVDESPATPQCNPVEGGPESDDRTTPGIRDQHAKLLAEKCALELQMQEVRNRLLDLDRAQQSRTEPERV